MKNLESEKQEKSGCCFFVIIFFVISFLILAGLFFDNINLTPGSKHKSARAFVSSSFAEEYYSDVGEFPESLLELKENLNNKVGWNGPYLEDSIKFIDPWGNPYNYQSPRKKAQGGYDLWSNGPDGDSGTADDIGDWE